MLDLLDYRRRVAEIYCIIRELGTDAAQAHGRFQHVRDELLQMHSQSPLDEQQNSCPSGFRDTTSGLQTYGGGRYLYDTIKGADLGATLDELVLDFSYAYHPSCHHNPRWVCPLAPLQNRLDFPISVGEIS